MAYLLFPNSAILLFNTFFLLSNCVRHRHLTFMTNCLYLVFWAFTKVTASKTRSKMEKIIRWLLFCLYMYLAPVESPPSNVPTSAASNASRGHSPQPQTVTSSPAANVEPAAGAVGGQPATSTATHDDAVLRERLKHMGKSKHCFFTLACICFGFVLQCTMRLS